MFSKLIIDWIQCGQPTEHGWFNDRDEVYFIISGGTTIRTIPKEKTRISPPPPEDYYGMKQGDTHRSILLWDGYVPPNSYASFITAVREQDNGALPAIITFATGISAYIIESILHGLAFPPQPANYSRLVNTIQESSRQLFDSFSSDGDQIIGILSILVENNNNIISIKWAPQSGASLLSPDENASVDFELHNSGGYTIRAAFLPIDHYYDLSAATGAPTAAGDPAVCTLQAMQHVMYRGQDGHIHQLYWNAADSWRHYDLSAATGAPTAAGDPAGLTISGRFHIVYRSEDGHVHELWWTSQTSWIHLDLSTAAGASVGATGNPAGYVLQGGQHVVYRGQAGHIHELWRERLGSF